MRVCIRAHNRKFCNNFLPEHLLNSNARVVKADLILILNVLVEVTIGGDQSADRNRSTGGETQRSFEYGPERRL